MDERERKAFELAIPVGMRRESALALWQAACDYERSRPLIKQIIDRVLSPARVFRTLRKLEETKATLDSLADDERTFVHFDNGGNNIAVRAVCGDVTVVGDSITDQKFEVTCPRCQVWLFRNQS